MKPIVCRVNPRLWWFVPLALGEAAFMLVSPAMILRDAPTRHSLWANVFLRLLCWPMGSLFLWAMAWMFTELRHGQVRADENGLRWRRGFAPAKTARWDEISDFYLHKTQVGTHTIETAHGKLELSGTYLGISEIAELVPQRAFNARARAWDVRGFGRDAEWEQTLCYWSKSQKWTAPAISATLFFCVGVLIWGVFFAPESKASKGPSGVFWLDAFPLIMGALLFGSLAFFSIWAIVSMWRERNFAWRHRAQTLRLDARGLLFSAENERVEASWKEVRHLETLAPQDGVSGVQVQTENGAFVLWALSESRMLSQFLARCGSYAPGALEAWRARQESQSLDQELNALPDENGARRFSFRTVGNRLTLLCGTVALFCGPLFTLVILYQKADDDHPFAPSWPLMWGAVALATLICGALWLWFARAFVRADADGLELHSPFRRARRVRWADVEASGHDVWGDYVRAGGRKIYWRRGLAPARQDELGALIQKRGAI